MPPGNLFEMNDTILSYSVLGPGGIPPGNLFEMKDTILSYSVLVAAE